MPKVSGVVVESSNLGRFYMLLVSRQLNLELAVMVPAEHLNDLLFVWFCPLSFPLWLNPATENLTLHYWL